MQSELLPVLAYITGISCCLHTSCVLVVPTVAENECDKTVYLIHLGAHHFFVVQGVEATLFATLMSVLNGGAFAGSTFGALLTKSFGVTSEDFTNLAPLVTVCTLSSLLPLPLLRMLPQGSTTEQIQSNNDQESESA